jgi:prephenate dehydrogenase
MSPTSSRPQPPTSLGLIGVGAFGAFALPHLAAHFDVTIHDVSDIAALAKQHGVKACDLAEVAACDIVVFAVPVQRLESVLQAAAPYLKKNALVIDVASVKLKPTEMMQRLLPATVDIVGTHPLFGPQSGKNGIAGLNIAVCDVRGGRGPCVASFLRDQLKLSVFETTAEAHDKQLAYVQGLTHLLAKVIVSMDLPEYQLTTKTYDLLMQMVGMVRYDSDELFKAIERENPFTTEAKRDFFAAARQLEEALDKKA